MAHSTGMPCELDQQERVINRTYNGQNLSTWRRFNWGVTNDVDDINSLYFSEQVHKSAEISGWFDTADTSPINACKGFLTKHPECRISIWYRDFNNGFAGKYVDGVHEFINEDFDEDYMSSPAACDRLTLSLFAHLGDRSWVPVCEFEGGYPKTVDCENPACMAVDGGRVEGCEHCVITRPFKDKFYKQGSGKHSLD